MLTERQEIIELCLKYPGAYEDYPFHDPNWCVMRHQENKKGRWHYESKSFSLF